ncbi:MAG: glyoxalase [Alphaproteobacteria bacterium]|nr:MAG: glyoxalase [Alphaproteobacteria bacterium]
MSGLSGLDRVVYGVEDMATSRKFFADWGLTLIRDEEDIIVFETLEKAQVVLRPMNAADLPAPIEDGPTIREVIWGADSQEDLDRFLAGIDGKVETFIGHDGMVRTIDPNGMTIGFQLTLRRDADVKGVPSNPYGMPLRVDLPAPVYERAIPTRLAHVVFFVSDLEAHREFYIEKLGFNITDEYPGRGFFSRCVKEGTHHNLFLLETPDKKKGVNHLSFGLRDIYEVMGGGIHFAKCGWDTQLGPGRHPISSAFFWYFFCPGGGLVEYYADEDYLTEKWQARKMAPSPEKYAEWAVADGIDPVTRRQKLRKVKV